LRFIEEKGSYISYEKYNGLKRHTLEPDDILFSSFIAGEIRVCLFPPNLSTPAINKADCFCIRTDRNICAPAFLVFRLASQSTFEGLKGDVHGATRPRISLSQLKKFEFDLPELAEQLEIARRIEAAFSWLDTILAEHQRATHLLPKLEAAILTKAFRGGLVPQNPDDEPASLLIDRLRIERSIAPPRVRQTQKRTRGVKDKKQRRTIVEVLSEAKEAMTPEKVFELAGFKAEAERDVETFFHELKTAVHARKVEQDEDKRLRIAR
jgi:type I restriction enzyme S subunit